MAMTPSHGHTRCCSLCVLIGKDGDMSDCVTAAFVRNTLPGRRKWFGVRGWGVLCDLLANLSAAGSKEIIS